MVLTTQTMVNDMLLLFSSTHGEGITSETLNQGQQQPVTCFSDVILDGFARPRAILNRKLPALSENYSLSGYFSRKFAHDLARVPTQLRTTRNYPNSNSTQLFFTHTFRMSSKTSRGT